ncbi:MAG: 1-acyl-sn-glycerol-3-phosphate acyltransferase [bacterium]
MKLKEAFTLRFLVHLLFLRPLLWLIFGINIRGRENLDGLKRFILISNHNSHLDTLLLFAALPACQIMQTRPVAAGDYFSRWRWLFLTVGFLFRPIWVDRENQPRQALPAIQQAIAAGQNLILFPEGTRGKPGELQDFRHGVGRILAANPSLPVVAAFIEGPERAFPRGVSFPIPLWNHVTITPPQLLRGNSQDITHSLQKTLENLSDQAHCARQQRPVARAHIFTVAVLGIDGSGKSTLSRWLARAFSGAGRSCLISDELEIFAEGQPRDLQPLLTEKLRCWLGAQAKQARSLVLYKIPKLTELLLRDRLLSEASRWYRPQSIFMDGMPLLNLTAWAILYREEHFTEEVCAKIISVLTRDNNRVRRHDAVFRQFPELTRLQQLRLDRMHMPDAVIFLDVPPAVCMERIDSRGETKQVHETEEKLAKLQKAYLLVCSVLTQQRTVPVLVLDGDRELVQVTAEAQGFLDRIGGKMS